MHTLHHIKIIFVQGAQYNMNRHRSMSGGAAPGVSSKGNQFQFPDGQYPNNGGQGQNAMMFSQQQQQIFNQNRHLQRQMSLPPGM